MPDVYVELKFREPLDWMELKVDKLGLRSEDLSESLTPCHIIYDGHVTTDLIFTVCDMSLTT